ncbi:hypothetical protein ACFL7M_07085 [Thermodesulfobacteriota bacterium]
MSEFVQKGKVARYFKKLSKFQSSIPIILGSGGIGLIQSLGERQIRSIVIDDGPASERDQSKYCLRLFIPNLWSHPIKGFEYIKKVGHMANDQFLFSPILFPTSDYVLEYLLDFYEETKSFSHVVASSKEVLSLTLNKVSFGRWLKKNGFPHPKIYFSSHKVIIKLEDSLGEIDFPCIIKPGHTFKLEKETSQKLIIAQSREETFDICRMLSQKNLDYIIQEIIPGEISRQFALAGYCSKPGRIDCIVQTNKLRQSYFGAGTFVASANIPEVERIGVSIIEKLGYQGIFELEFKQDERDNQFKVIELNPRTWSQIKLSTRLGVNIPFYAYENIIGHRASWHHIEEKKSPKYWVHFEGNLSFWRKSILSGHIDISYFLKVLLSIPIVEPFSFRDMGPGIFCLLNRFYKKIRQFYSKPL